MTSVKKPDFAGLRSEIDALYPAYKGRIAVNRHAHHNDSAPVRRDIAEQIDPGLVTRVPAKFMRGIFDLMEISTGPHAPYLLGHRFENATYQFFEKFPERDPGQPSKPVTADDMEPAVFSYICIDERPLDPRKMFYKLSSNEIPPERLKFNTEAANPDAMKWFVFFHELCHATIHLNIHDHLRLYYEKHDQFAYNKEMEEAICDAYAATHVLRLYGDSALPMLRTWADMRLSRFPTEGHKYFTGPTIRDILAQYQAGTLQDNFAAPDAIFVNARDTARRNFIEEDRYYAAAGDLGFAEILDAFRFEDKEETIREKVIAIYHGYAGKQPHELTDHQRRLSEHFREAGRVLERDYKDSAWSAFKGGLKRSIMTPLHKLGLAPHPGY